MNQQKMRFGGQDEDTTTYFTSKTKQYDRFRPDYPSAAVAWVMFHLPDAPLIADVGCGTGIASRAFARAGARVIGIEPNESMRRAAQRHGGGIDYRDGTAEATGLSDHSVDGVVCAQAFHWFDAARALHEFDRILREGGRLALLWNERARGDGGAADAYETLMERSQALAEQAGREAHRTFTPETSVRAPFVKIEERFFPNPAQLTWEELLGRAQSASYFPDSGELETRMTAELRAIFDRYQEDGVVTIAQLCRVILAHRRE